MMRTDATPVRVVSADEVLTHTSATLALEAARTAARLHWQSQVHSARLSIPLPGGWMRVLASSLPTEGVFGYKEFHYSPGGAVRYAVHLFAIDDGRPLGIVDAAPLTPLRTAASAAAAAAAYYPDQDRGLTVAVIGSSTEAMAGLTSLAATLPLASARVVSRRAANREQFAATATSTLGLPVRAVAETRQACDGADLVYVATNSGGVVVAGPEDLADVPLVLTIGSTMTDQRELSGRVFTSADRVVLDTFDAWDESGDIVEARVAGLERDRVELLGAYLAAPGRPAGRLVYKSIGSPEQDIALAAALVRWLGENEVDGRTIETLSDIKQNL
jgi:ornithine cyclodeaminase/alanine dehydrogenase-like protein (mu-crystallin family)